MQMNAMHMQIQDPFETKQRLLKPRARKPQALVKFFLIIHF